MEELLAEDVVAAEDRRAEAEAARQDRVEREAERERRERVWAARHPAEWAEWTRVRLLLNGPIPFGDDSEFDFEAFVAEVGTRPSRRHFVTRIDDSRPYTRANLTWRVRGRVETEVRPVDSPYLTVEEAAAYCRRSRKTVLNHHSMGSVRSVPGTRPPLFRKEDLDGWLSGRRPQRRK